MNYEQVYNDLTRAERSVKAFMRSEYRTENEKEILEKSLGLVGEAKENCRLVQAGHIKSEVMQGIHMGM